MTSQSRYKRDSGDRTESDSADAEVAAMPVPVDGADRKERVREVIGWIIRATMALAVVVLLVGSLAFGLPRLANGSEIAFASAILGVSIAFTGVLVPCVILMLSRRSTVTGMIEDMMETGRQVDRGLEHAEAIREGLLQRDRWDSTIRG